MKMEEKTLSIRTLPSIRSIKRENWDRLLARDNPFLRWDWLDMLEQTGCVDRKTGWIPHHLIAEHGNETVAACPSYLKTHSMGEFVFDFEWARYASQIGIRYYPKILIGIPFTPATGPRFLTATGWDRKRLIQQIGRTLIKQARENQVSTVHVNFCLEDEKEALMDIGFIPRIGLQYHWQNRGYGSFADYLLRLRSDRRSEERRVGKECRL